MGPGVARLSSSQCSSARAKWGSCKSHLQALHYLGCLRICQALANINELRAAHAWGLASRRNLYFAAQFTHTTLMIFSGECSAKSSMLVPPCAEAMIMGPQVCVQVVGAPAHVRLL